MNLKLALPSFLVAFTAPVIKADSVDPPSDKLTKSPLTDYLNPWDGRLEYYAKYNGKRAAVSSMKSTHHNHYEDRRFKFRVIVPEGYTSFVEKSFGNYNSNNEESFVDCPRNWALTTIVSIHSNWNEDRRWGYKCGNFGGWHVGECNWTDWVNDYDEEFTFDCPGEEVMGGMKSVHSNRYQDRIFNFKCCKMTKPSDSPSATPSVSPSTSPSSGPSSLPSSTPSVVPSDSPRATSSKSPATSSKSPSTSKRLEDIDNVKITRSVKGSPTALITQPSPNYILSFTIKPLGVQDGWTSIIHFTTGNNCCNYGDRVPGVWFHSGTTKLLIITGTIHVPNEQTNVPFNLKLNEESTIEVRVLGSSSVILVNGKIAIRKNIGKRPVLDKVKVYVGDPWYPASNAIISDISFISQ